MSSLDLTKSISDNELKNGAATLCVTKTGIITSFDNSKDVENGLDVFDNLTNNRMDEITYYLPRGTPS